jgi:transposase
VHAVDSGKTTRAVSALYQVSPAFASILHQHWRQTGHVHSKRIGGYRRALLEPYDAALTEQLSNSPSMTLKEVQAWLANAHDLMISISAIDKFLRQKLKLPL